VHRIPELLPHRKLRGASSLGLRQGELGFKRTLKDGLLTGLEQHISAESSMVLLINMYLYNIYICMNP